MDDISSGVIRSEFCTGFGDKSGSPGIDFLRIKSNFTAPGYPSCKNECVAEKVDPEFSKSIFSIPAVSRPMFRKWMIAINLLFAGLSCLQASNETPLLLSSLDEKLASRQKFLELKLKRIDSLTRLCRGADPERLFGLYDQLQDEYKSFRYDSAFRYVTAMNVLAPKLHDYHQLAHARILMAFTLLSSGLFKESLDTLNGIQISKCNKKLQQNFFSVTARTYYDLADYDNDDHFAVIYRRVGNQFLDSAIALTMKDSADYWSAIGLLRMKTGDFQGAADAFNFLLSRFSIPDHQYAIATSSLGYIYTILNRENEAIDMLIRAAIADVESSTRETVALRNLAVLLMKKGDIDRAYRYIKIALEDATFYNARHRKVEIGAVLPIIEGERLKSLEQQKNKISQYAIFLSLLSTLVFTFFLIIFFQLRRIKKVRNILQETNASLQEMNRKLSESNLIKEEYIGYFFTVNSEFIDKLENYRKAIHRKTTARQFEDIANVISSADLKKERENLFVNFDKIFLKLFPRFIEEFNAFFGEDDKVQLKHDELLNTDLRIYALMRLGITDAEKIARFLGYSVNTIYTYRTRIKNKISRNKDTFEELISGNLIS